MTNKFYAICISLFISLFAFIVVLHGFSSLQTGSGSGSKKAPSVKFTSWSVGRSSGTDTSKAEHLSFITSTGTSCQFSASVNYQIIVQNQKQNTSPIDPSTVKWTVTGASHKMKFDTNSVSSNWTGPNPSNLDTGTAFNMVAKLKVPAYKATKSCTAIDAKRAQRKAVHREGESPTFTLNFAAQTKAGHKVTASITFAADEKDQIRQEYVDLNKPIPGRGDFVVSNTYDFGHYGKMLDAGLDGYFQSWIDAMNKLYRTGKKDSKGKALKPLEKSNFGLNSGYRSPHHNYHHAKSVVVLSSHMYGHALDVNGRDIDGKKGADQTKMVNAADTKKKDGGAGARFSQKYKNKTHVHADWAPSDWKQRAYSTDKTQNTAGDPPKLSLPAGGTTISTSKRATTTSPTTTLITTISYACGVHSGDPSDVSSHEWGSALCAITSHANYICLIDQDHSRMITGYSGSFYECQPHQTDACGHTDPTANAAYHAPQPASCSVLDAYWQSCRETQSYVCGVHTHDYPNRIDGGCGHTYTVGEKVHTPCKRVVKGRMHTEKRAP